jgi:hyperosmotically inducible protein
MGKDPNENVLLFMNAPFMNRWPERFFSLIILILLCALLTPATTWSEVPQGQPGGLPVRRHRANHLIGSKVENFDGEKIGRVENFIIDRNSGKVEFVLISSGGVLGIGSATRPVPAAALNMYTAKVGVLAMDIIKPRWRAAPSYRNNSLRALGTPREVNALNGYYLGPASQSGPGHRDATAVQDNSPRAPGPLTLCLGNEIIGRSVIDQQNNYIGQITDLIVELPPRQPAFAIITTGRTLKKKHTYAVSLEILGKTKGDKLVLGTDPRSFDNAKPFDLASNAETKNDDIYLYSERKTPDASPTGVATKNLTPLQQSESPKDLAITQRIRQELMHDDALSLTAKNVKVITINGKVVLKGAVHTSKEKEVIQAQAEKIAGPQNVDNQVAVFDKP